MRPHAFNDKDDEKNEGETNDEPLSISSCVKESIVFPAVSFHKKRLASICKVWELNQHYKVEWWKGKHL